MTLYARRIAAVWLLVVATTVAVAAQSTGSIEGVVTDSSGARLPGVVVDLIAQGMATPIATSVSEGDGTYRLPAIRPGAYLVRFTLAGFSRPELRATVTSGATTTVPATLEVNGLAETVNVVADSIALDVSTSTQTTSFSNEALTELPTASRNYTHVIVAEAGVNAPLPDRTGAGLNIATNPGTQADDCVAVAQPERQRGAADQQRPAHQRRRRHEHAQRQRRPGQQHHHPARRARRGRSADGAAVGVARAQRRRQRRADHAIRQRPVLGLGRLLLPAREAERQRVLPEPRRRRQAGVPPQRRDGHARRPAAARPHAFLRRGAAPGVPVRLRDQRERRDRSADRADRHRATRRRLPASPTSGSAPALQDDPRFAQNFMNALRAFPAEQQAGLIAQFFADPARLDRSAS